jgi:competence protein ComEA
MKTIISTIVSTLIGLLLGLLVAGGLFLTTRAPSGQPVVLLPSPTPKPIQVFVTGAVKRPGVFLLPRESRVRDAVLAAGGFMEEGVDIGAVNLAKVLTDGERLDIPGTSPFATPQLTIGGDGLLVTPTPAKGQAVNINTATQELLETLPGIGPTTAKAIIDYRLENGPFATIDDLLKVPGIGPSTMEDLQGLITTGS